MGYGSPSSFSFSSQPSITNIGANEQLQLEAKGDVYSMIQQKEAPKKSALNFQLCILLLWA
uniref:Uncharacterized protein n=1 Tax=Solanum tuberosum TaxID=4113 RepID=M1CVK0_SOLTU